MTITKTKTTTESSQKNGHVEMKQQRAKDPMAVTWMENYSDTVEKYWSKLPASVSSVIAGLAVFIFGATVRGEWIHIAVHFLRAFYGETYSDVLEGRDGNHTLTGLEAWNLQDLPYYWLVSITISYTFFFGIGGFLHWYYYVNRRHLAHEWKCQPDKWMSPELEKHEIMLGSFSLLLGSTISSVVSCYVMNGGQTCIYYDIKDYGWLWFFLSMPVTFVYQDYLTYWHHRIYHHPVLYRHFHKLHHRYKQPTAFSVTAIHPVEFVQMQLSS
uniref:Delta(7)-sterol 5(6)-desaturase erg32-like isoform X1 n=2 Tax=Hirondellea gigas TaxID=1518452 RepID=A0A6A7G422_9CRUS